MRHCHGIADHAVSVGQQRLQINFHVRKRHERILPDVEVGLHRIWQVGEIEVVTKLVAVEIHTGEVAARELPATVHTKEPTNEYETSTRLNGLESVNLLTQSKVRHRIQ